MRAAPPTNRPISGRRENMRFPATLSGMSGNRDFGISSGRHGGVYWIPAARFATSPSLVLQRVTGENGVRKLTNRPDRRGSAFESRPARKSPDFGPTRKSAVPGDIVGDARYSGFRAHVRMSLWESIGFQRRVFPTSPSRGLEGASGENGVGS